MTENYNYNLSAPGPTDIGPALRRRRPAPPESPQRWGPALPRERPAKTRLRNYP